MSPTATPARFTTLPDEAAINATVIALEEHGFSVEVAGDLDAVRQAVLARIPAGSSVMTQHLGDAGPGRDRGRDQRRRRAVGVGAQHDVRAGFRDPGAADKGDRRPARLRAGQRARHHPGRHPGDRVGVGQPAGLLRLDAAKVIFVVGAQKLVPTRQAAHERIYQHSLPQDARAQAAYGQHNQVGKILEIHAELPGRIHVVLIRQSVGF